MTPEEEYAQVAAEAQEVTERYVEAVASDLREREVPVTGDRIFREIAMHLVVRADDEGWLAVRMGLADLDAYLSMCYGASA